MPQPTSPDTRLFTVTADTVRALQGKLATTDVAVLNVSTPNPTEANRSAKASRREGSSSMTNTTGDG